MKTTFFALVIAAMITLMSCNEDGSTMSGLEVNMKATTTTSKINKSGRVQAGGYAFEQALIGVREFEFETKEEDDDDDNSGSSSDDDDEEVEFRGNYVVDLIKGTSTPDLTNGKLKPGIYEEFEVELGRTLANGNSIFIVFKYKPDAGDSVKVEISSKATFEFEYEDDNGFEIKDETLTNYLVLINLDQLLNGLDLTKATKSEDGVVRINDTTNSSLLSVIKNNFDDSCEGGKDDDNDDDLMMTTINELIHHPTLYKGDRVLLMSGKEGEILERFDMKLKTYRIRVLENNEVVYFDETKLKLKRKHILNVLLGR